jgi:predicted AAA+ superfamily ATPase
LPGILYNTSKEKKGVFALNKREDAYHKLKKTRVFLSTLSLYREILNKTTMCSFLELVDSLYNKDKPELFKYIDLYSKFVSNLMNDTPSMCFAEYIVKEIIYTSGIFSSTAEFCRKDEIDSSLKNIVCTELKRLQFISGLNSRHIKNYMIDCFSLSGFEADAVNSLPEWNAGRLNAGMQGNYSSDTKKIIEIFMEAADWAEIFSPLADFYYRNGTGIFARHNAFIWDYSDGQGFLRGVEYPDRIKLSELIGYESERSQVIENTLQFLDGFPANNVLLYGDRGTGKSSAVKAIVNEYHDKGLRIVEVPKNRLMDFPKIANLLRKSRLKFIIFVDDLAFEDNEENFTALKAVLEGSVETKPTNVLIYATSNRKHIIKEKFSDRAGLSSDSRDDEIRAADSIQEKLSLSDRFGVTVVFSSPEKQKYLEIAAGLAKRRGLDIDMDYLCKEAMKWELWYNGRSPRTAVQFVNWLEGKIAKKPEGINRISY